MLPVTTNDRLSPKSKLQVRTVSVLPTTTTSPSRHPEEMGSIDAADCFNQDAYSDVTIKCEGVEFKCHKLILCSKSEYFKVLCGPNGRFKESAENVIELKEDFADAVKAMLKYIHTSDYSTEDLFQQASWSFHVSVMEIGDKYGLEDLDSDAFQKVKNLLEGCTNVNPVLDFLEHYTEYADRHTRLQALAGSLTVKHLPALFKHVRFRKSLVEDTYLTGRITERVVFAEGLKPKPVVTCGSERCQHACILRQEPQQARNSSPYFCIDCKNTTQATFSVCWTEKES